jgi:major intracellular serine protease
MKAIFTALVLVSALVRLDLPWSVMLGRGVEQERTFLVYSVTTPRVGRVIYSLPFLPGWYIVRAPRIRPLEDGVLWAIEDYKVTAHGRCDQCLRAEWERQWGIFNDGTYMLNSPVCHPVRPAVRGSDANVLPAWEVTDGDGVVVAVTDTGVDTAHPELKDAVVWAVSMVPTEDEKDYNGHGTHVSGIIAAARNGQEPVGVMPRARIVSVKILDKTGSGFLSWIARGFNEIIRYVAEGGHIDAINASWGGYIPRDMILPVWRDIMDQLRLFDIPLVVSAGNSNVPVTRDDFVCGLGDIFDSIICVGALTPSGGRACFSNCSPEYVHILAPGEDILSTLPDGRMAFWSGTSMAAPFATAVVGAVRHMVGTIDRTRWVIRRSAVPVEFFPRRPVGDENETFHRGGWEFLMERGESPCDTSRTMWAAWGALDAGTALMIARALR